MTTNEHWWFPGRTTLIVWTRKSGCIATPEICITTRIHKQED